VNEHVVDGQKLTELVQDKYELEIKLVKRFYPITVVSDEIAKINDKYKELCREFKITIKFENDGNTCKEISSI
jgi:DNA-directed RNA polymerase subunit L